MKSFEKLFVNEECPLELLIETPANIAPKLKNIHIFFSQSEINENN